MKKQPPSTKRKRRRDKFKSYKQGLIQQVSDLFFAPLIKYRPPYYSRQDWLEFLFGMPPDKPPLRYVEQCKAKRAFRVKGHLWGSNGAKKMSDTFLQVKRGDTVFVRIDTGLKYDSEITLEIIPSQGRAGFVVDITDFQFARLKGSIEIVSYAKKSK